MRAWQVTALGEPAEVLKEVELPDPVAGPGQVVIEVEAAALGFPDLLACRGLYHDRKPLPFVPGGELCGQVVGTGERVIVNPTGHGGIAQRVAVDAEQLLPVPDSMSATVGAALFVAYHTAHIGLYRRAALRPGETLLVHAAAGGVGSAAVQLGKATGARVIAVAGGPRKAAACREWGADVVIDHREQDFVAVVKDVTDGRGADVIYDPVGGEVFDRSRKCIAVEGRLLVVGFASGTIPTLPVNHALLKNYSVVGFRTRPFRDDPVYRREVHDSLIALLERGEIAPAVEEADFADVPAVLARIDRGEVIGRSVVRIPLP